MSFGFSVGDFAALGQLAWTTYRAYKACKDAPEGFKNITQEVLSLHVVLKELKKTHSDANLSADQQSHLRIVGDGCRKVLHDLQRVVARYNSLGTETKRTRDRLAWGSVNITQLRLRLISNTLMLTSLFVNTSQAIVQKKLDNVQKTLDMILQEIRDGKHEASIGSSQTVDSLSTEKRQTWRAIGKELEDIGISLTPFDANKDFIMNWFKIAKSTGAFKEVAAEEDGSSKEDLSQSLEDPEHDTLSSQKTLEDPGRDAKPTSASVGLQALKLSPKAKPQTRHPQREKLPSTPLPGSITFHGRTRWPDSRGKAVQRIEKATEQPLPCEDLPDTQFRTRSYLPNRSANQVIIQNYRDGIYEDLSFSRRTVRRMARLRFTFRLPAVLQDFFLVGRAAY